MDRINISIQITPPSSPPSSLTTDEYVQCSSLKRKIQEILSPLPFDSNKRLKLDSSSVAPILSDYMAQLPEDRLSVSIPGDKILKETRAIFENINICLEDHAQIALGNLIILLAQKVFPETRHDTNNSRLLVKCQTVTDQQLRDANIPEKYWLFIKDLKTYNQHRNQAAHHTPVQLANLLSSITFRELGISEEWADAYRLVYHRSYEEMKGNALSMYRVRRS